MTDTLPLALSEPAHTRLASAANGRGKMASVVRTELFDLMRDHSSALAKLNEMGVKSTAQRIRK